MKPIIISAPVLLGATIAAASGSHPARAGKEAGKPNIIIILADDMGYECVGAYGGSYKTPNIDRLAEQGIRFNYAYALPISTPSRVQMLTGKYNHKNYVEFGFMNQDQKTFANLAKTAGYATGVSGKWQMGANPKIPLHFGFDTHCLYEFNYPGQSECYAYALLEENGKIVERNPDLYGPEYQAGFVDRFIDANKKKPFLLYYPISLVHSPFTSTPLSHDWATNTEGRYKHNKKYFPDMMEYCDLLVGRLVDKLKKEGLYDRTLIIFTADNGTLSNIVTQMKDGTSVKGGKGLTTDAGTHVPFIVTYGSRQGAARTCDDLVDLTDVLPSVAQAMGMDVPREWDTDGVSFLPQVMGESATPRQWTFLHFARNPAFAEKRYIRNHRYKLYSTGEFYDIQEDIFEKTDILSGNGGVEAEKNRQFLASELAKFPAWKAGDTPVKKVTLPGLESKYVNNYSGPEAKYNNYKSYMQ